MGNSFEKSWKKYKHNMLNAELVPILTSKIYMHILLMSLYNKMSLSSQFWKGFCLIYMKLI